MRKIFGLIALFALLATPAAADWTGKDAAGATVTFKNTGTCTAVVCVPQSQPYDGTNAITFTTAGGDAVSNTQTGMPVYARMSRYNGATWDRWTGAVTVASGGIASGAIASGAVASGAYASGSIGSGAMVDLGAIADAASTAGGTGTLSAKLRLMTTQLDTINTTLGASIPAGTNLIGDVNLRQGGSALSASNPTFTRDVDGTRSRVLDPCESNVQSYASISITTATTTRIVAPSAGNKTYICSLFLTSAAADNVGIVEGTGGTCGTGTAGVVGGTTAANGPNFAANGGVMMQAGGKTAVAQTAGTNVDLCLITSAATPLAGGIKYVQAP